MYTVTPMAEFVSVSGVSSARKYKKEFYGFKGVDFSTDPTQVADERSPDALNLISDLAGFPEKRLGYRKLWQKDSPVNGLFYAVLQSGKGYFLAHVGDCLYDWEDMDTPICTGMRSERSCGFAHGGCFYLLDGATYRVIREGEEGLSVASVSEQAFVPTTVIGATPAGAGTAFEAVNLLTPWRKNSFAGDGSAKVYQLDATELDETAVTAVVDGTEMTESSGITVDRTAGTVTFATAPPVYAGGSGVDNVVITFAKTVGGNADIIHKCSVFAQYGYNNDNRFFFAGNPDKQNVDYQSGLDDPTYFPDTGYTKIGADSSAIMGYAKQGDSLAIIKEDNEQDAEVFLRTAAMDEAGVVIFPVKQGVKGVGAISKYAFATLKDEPLFLAREGLYAICSTAVNQQRNLENRSWYVDAKLRKEESLDQAVSAIWNGYYVLCVNSHCYVADSRQKSGKGYEWYYWDNVNARVFLEYKGTLYFGTADGALMRFNDDIATMSRYSDDGAPILARWTTKAEDFSDYTIKKTLHKRGCGVMIKPYTRSSVEVYIITENRPKQKLMVKYMDIFDFSDVDFERIDFNTSSMPQLKPFNAKRRRFNLMQLMFVNHAQDEGFGIYGASLTYSAENYIK